MYPLNTKKLSYRWQTTRWCPLVNDCNLWASFSDFYPPISHLTPSPRGIASSYPVYISVRKNYNGRATEHQRDRHTDSHETWQTHSHVAMANAAPLQCASGGKNSRSMIPKVIAVHTSVFIQTSKHCFPGLAKTKFQGFPGLKKLVFLEYQHYHLRQRPHNKALIPKTTYLSDRDYIIRMLYKNCY